MRDSGESRRSISAPLSQIAGGSAALLALTQISRDKKRTVAGHPKSWIGPLVLVSAFSLGEGTAGPIGQCLETALSPILTYSSPAAVGGAEPIRPSAS